jgi:hypothetical protein
MILDSEQRLLKSLCGARTGTYMLFFHVAGVCMPFRIISYKYSELAEKPINLYNALFFRIPLQCFRSASCDMVQLPIKYYMVRLSFIYICVCLCSIDGESCKLQAGLQAEFSIVTDVCNRW